MSELEKSLRHAELKIIWANHLIINLDLQIKSFIKAKPYTISLDPDPGGIGYLVNVNLKEGLPLTIPCLVGDICQNLRASADTCWMGVMKDINPMCGRSYLPIRSTEEGVKKAVKDALKGKARSIVMDILIDRIKPHHQFGSGGNFDFHCIE